MPVYTVQGPDGRTYDIEGPEGATADDLGAVIESNAQQNYSNEGRMHPLVNPDASSGPLDRYAAGVSGAADTLRTNINDAIRKVLPSRQESIFGGPAMSPPSDPEMDASIQRSRNRSALYEPSKDQLGFAGTLGDITPEIALTAAPIARAGTAAARAPLLVKTLGKYAPAVADIGVNAAYSGAKSAAQGNDASTVARDTMFGAGGAAAGRALPLALRVASAPVRAVANRMTSGISPEAQALLAQGITPTYGQALPGGILSGVEELSKRVPGFGAAVERGQVRTGQQYAAREIENAMSPLGNFNVDEAGFKAVARANDLIDQSYNAVVPHTHWTPQDLDAALQVTRGAADTMPLLTDAERAQFKGYINQKFEPLVQAGQVVDGRTARDIDISLGKDIRRLSNTSPALSDALGELQKNLRGALDAVNPQVKTQLTATNQAFKNMIPIAKAVDRAGNKQGMFTPNQYRRAAQGKGALDLSAGPLNDAAMETIGPTGGGAFTRNVLSGSALFHDPTSLAVVGGLYGAGRLAYSEPVVQTTLKLMNLMPHIRSWAESLPPVKQAEFIARMATEDPLTRSLVSQVGRQLATQGAQP